VLEENDEAEEEEEEEDEEKGERGIVFNGQCRSMEGNENSGRFGGSCRLAKTTKGRLGRTVGGRVATTDGVSNAQPQREGFRLVI